MISRPGASILHKTEIQTRPLIACCLKADAQLLPSWTASRSALKRTALHKSAEKKAERRSDGYVNSFLEAIRIEDQLALVSMAVASDWSVVKQLTPEEHWFEGAAHNRNWHGHWVKYRPEDGVWKPFEDFRAVRELRTTNEGRGVHHTNHYFKEEGDKTQGPWENDISSSKEDGVIHPQSQKMRTYYLDKASGTAWAVKQIVEGEIFGAELFLILSRDVRASFGFIYRGGALMSASIIREDARDSAEKLIPYPQEDSFWSPSTELQTEGSRADIATELVGRECRYGADNLTVFERKGRFGGYRGGESDTGGCKYEVLRYPDNASVRFPRVLEEGVGFELSASIVLEEGKGAAQISVTYDEGGKLKWVTHGVYFA